MSRSVKWLSAVGVSMAIVSCSGSSGSGSSATLVPTSPSSTIVPRTSDGVLRLGLLIPAALLTADATIAFHRVVDAVTASIQQRRATNDLPIEVLVGEESQDYATTLDTVQTMVDKGIDALIGPFSSSAAGVAILDLTDQGIGVCSPGATSVLLTSLYANDLAIRTAKNDNALVQAMTDLVVKTGYAGAPIVYPNDRYGRAFADALDTRLQARGLNVTTDDPNAQPYDVPYTVDADGMVNSDIPLEEISSQKILFVGDAESARHVLPLLKQKDIFTSDQLYGLDTSNIVDPNGVAFSSVGTTITGVLLDSSAGSREVIASLTALGADLGSITDPDIAFLAPTIDCLNILALASKAANSDLADAFMPEVFDVTTSGSVCATYVQCHDALEGFLNIDYSGAIDNIDLDIDGLVTTGSVLIYRLDTTGVSTIIDRRTIDARS